MESHKALDKCQNETDEIHRHVDARLRQILSDDFFHETTMHGFAHLSNAGSMKGVAFWVIITSIAFIYAGHQIFNDIKRLYSQDMMITFRPPKAETSGTTDAEERKHPLVEFCYNHWIYWLDWRKAYYNQNLTKSELFYMASMFAGDLHTDKCVNSTNVRRSLCEKFGEIIKFGKLMKKLLLEDLVEKCFLSTISPQMATPHCYFTPMPSKLCISFQQPYDAQTTSKEFIFFNKLSNIQQDGKFTKFELNFITKIMSSQIIGDIFVDSIPIKEIQIQNIIGHELMIKPSAVNFPTNRIVDCPKLNLPTIHKATFDGPSVMAESLFCENGFHESDNANDSLNFELTWQEQIPAEDSLPGLQCFTRKYELSHEKEYRGGTSTSNHLFILINIADCHTWIITEYKPALSWDQLIANIGGTLGVWTGASILSFIHLIHFLLVRGATGNWWSKKNLLKLQLHHGTQLK